MDGKFRIGGSDFKILRDMFLGLENMKFWNFTWGLWRWGATGFQDPSDVFFSPASEGLQRPGDSVWHQAAFFSEWKGCQCRRHQAAIFHVVQCSAICRLACGFYLASWTDLSDAVMSWCRDALVGNGSFEVCASALSCGFVAATQRDPLKELAQNDTSATWNQSHESSLGDEMHTKA